MANFEEQLTALETVVEKLERGDLSLDESVHLFEEGLKLSNACKKELEAAEGKIQVLIEQGRGKTQVIDLDLAKNDELGDEEE
ncbi:exodeoxyribonuclease VII small subunit [Tunturiibacter gelidoferens]|uniref:Exodeoxyribonuclease VII small subunit n=1 Tax=Tunturiibacter gelidiferens TaxID=3069689 RepID=A0ACC5NZ37_9BACT|nr:exodeoxyribonuclease VII small subunit [Edaphobacter lichenicola]MBB5339633.1 exodeoxyribonuclease VII small subunit [Edaphobacter lichenicola]